MNSIRKETMPYTYICPWSWLHNVCLNFSELIWWGNRIGREVGVKWGSHPSSQILLLDLDGISLKTIVCRNCSICERTIKYTALESVVGISSNHLFFSLQCPHKIVKIILLYEDIELKRIRDLMKYPQLTPKPCT